MNQNQPQKSETGADKALVAIRAAHAALSQAATFPADIRAARVWLADAINALDPTCTCKTECLEDEACPSHGIAACSSSDSGAKP